MTKPEVRCKWRGIVSGIYSKFGDGPWTSKDVREFSKITKGEFSGMITHLRTLDVVRSYTGTRRCTYGGTQWAFTRTFVHYMKTGGIERFESCENNC